MLCAVSRGLNRLLTGRRTTICGMAYVHDMRRLQAVLDRVMAWRDLRDHCLRSAVRDALDGAYGTGWGVSDGVDRTGL